MAPIRREAIIWTNDDLISLCIYSVISQQQTPGEQPPLFRDHIFGTVIFFSIISYKFEPVANSHLTNLIRGQRFWLQPPLISSHQTDFEWSVSTDLAHDSHTELAKLSITLQEITRAGRVVQISQSSFIPHHPPSSYPYISFLNEIRLMIYDTHSNFNINHVLTIVKNTLLLFQMCSCMYEFIFTDIFCICQV